MFNRHLSTVLCCGALCVTLGACSKEVALRYTVSANVADPGSVVALITAAQRVVQRRLAAIGETKASVVTAPTGGSGGTLTVKLKTDNVVPRVKTMLAEPFSFEIRLEKPAATTATASGSTDTANASDWLATGITKDNLLGVRTIVNSTTGEAAIELDFTPEGRVLLAKLFKENKGKNIAIFVRDLMVSRLQIQSTELDEHIVISGIPSAAVGEVFSDDVNVGLYVTYTPVE
jgi:hypothetical protein